VYKHFTDRTTEFAFPLPTHDEVQFSPKEVASPLLYFRARRAVFEYAAPTLKDDSEELFHPTVTVLLNAHKQPVGVIKLHANTKESWAWHEMVKELDEKPRSAEFIAISEGSIQLSKEESRFKTEIDTLGPFPDGKYEFYNVLRIKWQDGIAYREGLGRVEKRAWNAADLEEIDIMLG